MLEDLNILANLNPDKTFINQIFRFDVTQLNQLSNIDVSRYIIALSQYLIYFKYQVNNAKMHLNSKQRLLDASLIELLTPEYLKKYKTKAEAKHYIIYQTPTLLNINTEIDKLNDELYLLQGIDKTIAELIASFKRELTRRENELYQERHS